MRCHQIFRLETKGGRAPGNVRKNINKNFAICSSPPKIASYLSCSTPEFTRERPLQIKIAACLDLQAKYVQQFFSSAWISFAFTVKKGKVELLRRESRDINFHHYLCWQLSLPTACSNCKLKPHDEVKY